MVKSNLPTSGPINTTVLSTVNPNISGVNNNSTWVGHPNFSLPGSGNFAIATQDFTFKTTISDEIRKNEPRKFYLLLEMLCSHIEEFKGQFPGEIDLKYKAKVLPSQSHNQIAYQIIFESDSVEINAS